MFEERVSENKRDLSLSDHGTGNDLARIGTLVQANGLLAGCQIHAAQGTRHG